MFLHHLNKNQTVLASRHRGFNPKSRSSISVPDAETLLSRSLPHSLSLYWHEENGLRAIRVLEKKKTLNYSQKKMGREFANGRLLLNPQLNWTKLKFRYGSSFKSHRHVFSSLTQSMNICPASHHNHQQFHTHFSFHSRATETPARKATEAWASK